MQNLKKLRKRVTRMENSLEAYACNCNDCKCGGIYCNCSTVSPTPVTSTISSIVSVEAKNGTGSATFS